jgi:aryl-alcohol dehydrogenase-like predicted oxidoreductase
MTVTVARIHAVQAEYSPFETLHESDGLLDTARELDIAFVAYGPLGHGWLVDHFPFETPDDFHADDYRRCSESISLDLDHVNY